MKRVNWIKYSVGLAACLALRLIPFRPPNMEPLMATAMPFAKKYGKAAGFLFGALSIVLFDLATEKIGVWTLVTAAAYGLVGLGAGVFFKDRRGDVLHYVYYSAIGTLAYDALTGLTVGPLVFGQSLMDAFTGQIPFTLMHLASNAALAAGISPLIRRFIAENPRLEYERLLPRASPFRG